MAIVTQALDIGAGVPFSSAIPELVKVDGTGTTPFPVFGYAFADTADEAIYFKLFAANYGASNPNVVVLLRWYAKTATTGNALWDCALAAISPGDAVSVEAKSLATLTAGAPTAASGTGKGLVTTTVTCTNLDSLTANDELWLRVRRNGNGGTDTMAGDAVLVGVTVQYSDT